jgi:deoxycytidine triphosphate deaminase
MLRLLSNYSFPGAPAPGPQLQPAGFDLTCAAVAAFAGTGSLDLDNTRRQLPDVQDLPWPAGNTALRLEPGGYLVTYNEQIAVPADAAGLVLPRSSLMRCGAVLHSALWDPGYTGRGQGLLTVYAPLELYRDARVGQFVLIALERAAEQLYVGQYQGENLK